MDIWVTYAVDIMTDHIRIFVQIKLQMQSLLEVNKLFELSYT